MNLQLVWDNLVAYSMQIGLLVGLAAFLPAALRLRLPASRLAYWHFLLAACLLLPAVRPWKQAVLTLTAYVPPAITAPVPPLPAPQPTLPPAEIALIIVGAGMLAPHGLAGHGLLAAAHACAATPGRSAPSPPGAWRPTSVSPTPSPAP